MPEGDTLCTWKSSQPELAAARTEGAEQDSCRRSVASRGLRRLQSAEGQGPPKWGLRRGLGGSSLPRRPTFFCIVFFSWLPPSRLLQPVHRSQCEERAGSRTRTSLLINEDKMTPFSSTQSFGSWRGLKQKRDESEPRSGGPAIWPAGRLQDGRGMEGNADVRAWGCEMTLPGLLERGERKGRRDRQGEIASEIPEPATGCIAHRDRCVRMTGGERRKLLPTSSPARLGH